QISMDGSQKLPQRLIGTLADRIRAGVPAERITLALAAWFRFLAGTDDSGRRIEVSDPRTAELTKLTDPTLPEATVVAQMLERSGLVRGCLAKNATLAVALARDLQMLRQQGAKAVLARPEFGGT